MVMERLQAALVSTYRIERELGGGGMSRVFVATERALDRPVVLKVLPPELAQAVSIERFHQEIRLAARLQHPHIVALLSAGDADGLLYYTMPFIEGESLRVRIARGGELPVREALRVLRDVAAALAYAHEHGVVHRDIKPDNVLLSGGEALVTDFGVAKALSASATGGASGLTSLGVALGTPAYMAPEQAAADPHVDHRADVYAFGCLAYEVLTGQAPFTGRSAAALLAAHMTDTPEAVERRRPQLPPALAALVMRCLEKRPADRPQASGEVLQALEAISTPSGGTEPTKVVRSSTPGGREKRRQRLLRAGVAALAIGAAATAAFYTRREPVSTTLDANLVAVAPFDALGPGLDLWREGFVDLLSRGLDGAGPLRTVSPSVVIRRWSGRSDPASATELGRITGAGLAVYGTLVGAGPDSVRISASILDVNGRQSVGEVQLKGDVRHMDALSDSLTVALLRELGSTRPIAATRSGRFGATSLPALKAFLTGERYYRRGAWDSAYAAYSRAMAADSTFVPALVRAAHAVWWGSGTQPVYQALIYRAASLNRGLGPRDSLIIVIDSNLVSLNVVDSIVPSVRRHLAKRMFEAVTELTARYPDDPEGWYLAGEARFHHGWMGRIRPREALEAFDRAIALDSAFSPAYVHTMHFNGWVSHDEGWDRHLRAYLKSGAAASLTPDVGLLQALRESDSVRSDSLLRAASVKLLLAAAGTGYMLPDSAEPGVRVTRELASRPAPSRQDALVWQAYYTLNLAYRGRVRQAARTLSPVRDLPDVSDLTTELALLGVIPADTADALLSERLQQSPFRQAGTYPKGGGGGALGLGAPWWAARGDTASLLRFAARADSAARASRLPTDAEGSDYNARAARAYLALVRGDSTGALRQLSDLPHDVAWGVIDRLTEAKLLALRGRDAEVLEMLDHSIPLGWASPSMVLSRLETARAAERLGQRERAVDDYQFVVEVWRHADPELRPYVEESRAAIARLSAERS
jgi:eukaryotic-like serine/threonine-protein kinase